MHFKASIEALMEDGEEEEEEYIIINHILLFTFDRLSRMIIDL